MVKCDASDVIVWAALPRVVEPESKGTGVSSIQSCVFPKCTVLHIDGPVINLHAPDGEITVRKQIHRLRFTLRSSSVTIYSVKRCLFRAVIFSSHHVFVSLRHTVPVCLIIPLIRMSIHNSLTNTWAS